MSIEGNLMKFRFDPNQEHQLKAIQSVIDLFKGQPKVDIDLSTLFSGSIPAVSNQLILDEIEILENLKNVQTINGVSVDSDLKHIETKTTLIEGEVRVQFPNFSVEMETGTGKTYVEIRTLLELYRCYGMRKFIIVVPSIAIREGILHSLQATNEHFKEHYSNPPYRYYIYDSSSLSDIKRFSLSNGIEIMIMTLASFNKDINVIKQPTDRLSGETPIHLIQACKPILILDEPQNMESPKSIQALATLNPLFTLRYSATHRNLYNLIYRLSPYEAYRQNLVKRIEVAGVEDLDDTNLPYLELENITTKLNSIKATLLIHKRLANGNIQEKSILVKPGDNLEKKTNRSDYSIFTVDEINPGWNEIRFSNGTSLKIGESTGQNKEAIWEAQIRYSIEEHLIKAKRLYPLGIKVLSLFFIDRVDNYVHEDSRIRVLFNKSFNSLILKYPEVSKELWGQSYVNPETIQGSYFANRHNKAGVIIYEDSTTGESQLDKETYDLIMKNKEKLLSFSEPISFIFSHSALREGWDNPNVFQICTLNQTSSEVKKRQEIGRGVRLAVDQDGNRNHEERVNVLTVAANESYEKYVSSLQSELDEEYTIGEQAPKPSNARKKGKSELNKAHFLSEDFKGLWESIKQKTRYSVKIDSEHLITQVIKDLDVAKIKPPRITITKGQVVVGPDEAFTAMQLTGARTMIDLAGKYPLPNLVSLMEELLERTSPPLRLSRKTLLEIYKQTKNQQAALDNPHEFARVAVDIIRFHLIEQLVDGIQYEKNGSWYDMSCFGDTIDSWEEYLVPAEHSLYNPVVLDSTPECTFLESLEKRKDVKLYVKLPRWFTVDTPVGTYQPDWAIVMEPVDDHGQPNSGPKVYLVHETKDTYNPSKLHIEEWQKIRCGSHHFKDALDISYSWGPDFDQ
jgi:type III restriction enzyme